MEQHGHKGRYIVNPLEALKNKQKEVKIGLALDDYKLKNKDEWWVKCLKKIPSELLEPYELIKEETGNGVTKNTVMVYRYYKLK